MAQAIAVAVLALVVALGLGFAIAAWWLRGLRPTPVDGAGHHVPPAGGQAP